MQSLYLFAHYHHLNDLLFLQTLCYFTQISLKLMNMTTYLVCIRTYKDFLQLKRFCIIQHLTVLQCHNTERTCVFYPGLLAGIRSSVSSLEPTQLVNKSTPAPFKQNLITKTLIKFWISYHIRGRTPVVWKQKGKRFISHLATKMQSR